MNIIRTETLTRTYAMGNNLIHALQDVNLTVDQGEFIAIMGTSGSGKSTLLNVLGLLDQPTEGNYWLENTNVSSMNANKLADIRGKRIGHIFQDFKLLPRLAAWENAALPLVYGRRKIKYPQQRLLAMQALNKVGLSDRADHLPTELSGGQRQRVAIARALITHPAVILADEPTGNLDSSTRNDILHLLSELNHEGITIVMVTHDRNIAGNANRICQMDDGRLTEKTRKI